MRGQEPPFHWTEQEERLLVQHYRHMPTREFQELMAKTFGWCRSGTAIFKKAYLFGLHKSPEQAAGRHFDPNAPFARPEFFDEPPPMHMARARR